MIKIRYGVFETNSSSCHSISFSNDYKPITKSKLKNINKEKESLSTLIDRYNNLVIPLGEFGWEEREYNDARTKLQYALTMAYVTECNNMNDFEETEGYKDISSLLEEEIGCNLLIPTNLEYCYIDHQSCEDYKSLRDFINDYGVRLYDFIFNSDVTLITDNDNH